ncbi:UDP-glycosyltransferase 92A1 [Forsythia ovata]|uniref:UDP-glycosyltransferase 92A1 n=1 Tax=Forsythia ovata TaxID=205694 RepID=A0ABD1PXA7_9LAMI
MDLKYVEAASFWFFFRQRQFSHCLSSDAILLNTIQELEDIGLEYFRRKTGGKPVWSVGPASFAVIKERTPTCNADYYTEWLNLHPPASVLYVCFGSMCSISASQTKELALGLETSGKAFIWVARPPTEFSLTEEFRTEWLPDGFEERMKKQKRGLLIHKLAPQNHILSHESIGAFLSHCGWNSILESLCRGIPIIGWPMSGEQFFNSHMLEKRGVCLELRDGNNAEFIGHECISEVIRTVMGTNEKGVGIRRESQILKAKLENAIYEGKGFEGSSAKAVDEFLGAIETASSFQC